MGLFTGKPKKGDRVCPVHGVYRKSTCSAQCVSQIRHASGYSESDRAQERESSGDPNSGW